MKRGESLIKTILRDAVDVEYIESGENSEVDGYEEKTEVNQPIKAKIIMGTASKLELMKDGDEKQTWIIVYTLIPLKLGGKLKVDITYTIKNTVGRPRLDPQFYVSDAVHTG